MSGRVIKVEGEEWKAVALVQKANDLQMQSSTAIKEAMKILKLAPGESVAGYNIEQGTVTVASATNQEKEG